MNSIINHIKWRSIATVGIIVLSIIAAVFVRVREVDKLQGKYLSGYDSYFYYRQAKTIVTEGRLPDRDYMQSYPDGLNLRGRANLNCYAIAYLYKAIRTFAPDISIERVAIHYPVILFTLILILFFLLTNLFFNKSTALIAVTIFATIPAAVVRTHAGWADRDPLSLLTWIACLYFYIAAYRARSQNGHRYLPFALLSGISMGALGLTWPGVGLLSLIIVVFNTVKILAHSYDRKNFYIYLCWYLPSILMMLLFTERYSSNPHRAYTLAEMALPSLFAIVVPTTYIIAVGLGILIRQVKTQSMRRILSGILVTSCVLLLFALVPLQQIINTFLHPATTGSFTATVSEFQEPQIFHWFDRYRFFFVFPLFGVLLVTYTLAEAYRMRATVVTGMLAMTLAATFLSTHPSMQHKFIEIVYISSVLLFIGTITVCYIRAAFNRQGHIRINTDILLLLLIWALFTLLYNRGALRFALFLAPPAVILGTYAIMFILKRAAGEDENRISNLAMLMCFMVIIWQLRTPSIEYLTDIGVGSVVASLVCVNLMVLGVIFILRRGNQEFSIKKKGRMGAKVTCLTLSIAMCIITGGLPHLLPNWISQGGVAALVTPAEAQALNWLETNTPTKSVVAAWWVHGSRIAALAERATIIDQQHNPTRIRAMAREVFCAETPEDALTFLKSQKATHLLIQPIDMFIFKQVYSLALGKDRERGILMERFRIDEQASSASDASKEKSTRQIPPQPSEYTQSLAYTTERYFPCDQEDSSASHVDVEYKSDGNFHKATIYIDDTNISPASVFFDDEDHRNLAGAGCVVVTNVDVHSPHRILEYKHAVYFSKEVSNSLAFQLYFFGSHTDHFEQIYPTQESESKDSSPFNDIKIWKINY